MIDPVTVSDVLLDLNNILFFEINYICESKLSTILHESGLHVLRCLSDHISKYGVFEIIIDH